MFGSRKIPKPQKGPAPKNDKLQEYFGKGARLCEFCGIVIYDEKEWQAHEVSATHIQKLISASKEHEKNLMKADSKLAEDAPQEFVSKWEKLYPEDVIQDNEGNLLAGATLEQKEYVSSAASAPVPEIHEKHNNMLRCAEGKRFDVKIGAGLCGICHNAKINDHRQWAAHLVQRNHTWNCIAAIAHMGMEAFIADFGKCTVSPEVTLKAVLDRRLELLLSWERAIQFLDLETSMTYVRFLARYGYHTKYFCMICKNEFYQLFNYITHCISKKHAAAFLSKLKFLGEEPFLKDYRLAPGPNPRHIEDVQDLMLLPGCMLPGKQTFDPEALMSVKEMTAIAKVHHTQMEEARKLFLEAQKEAEEAGKDAADAEAVAKEKMEQWLKNRAVDIANTSAGTESRALEEQPQFTKEQFIAVGTNRQLHMVGVKEERTYATAEHKLARQKEDAQTATDWDKSVELAMVLVELITELHSAGSDTQDLAIPASLLSPSLFKAHAAWVHRSQKNKPQKQDPSKKPTFARAAALMNKLEKKRILEEDPGQKSSDTDPPMVKQPRDERLRDEAVLVEKSTAKMKAAMKMPETERSIVMEKQRPVVSSAKQAAAAAIPSSQRGNALFDSVKPSHLAASVIPPHLQNQRGINPMIPNQGMKPGMVNPMQPVTSLVQNQVAAMNPVLQSQMPVMGQMRQNQMRMMAPMLQNQMQAMPPMTHAPLQARPQMLPYQMQARPPMMQSQIQAQPQMMMQNQMRGMVPNQMMGNQMVPNPYLAMGQMQGMMPMMGAGNPVSNVAALSIPQSVSALPSTSTVNAGQSSMAGASFQQEQWNRKSRFDLPPEKKPVTITYYQRIRKSRFDETPDAPEAAGGSAADQYEYARNPSDRKSEPNVSDFARPTWDDELDTDRPRDQDYRKADQDFRRLDPFSSAHEDSDERRPPYSREEMHHGDRDYRNSQDQHDRDYRSMSRRYVISDSDSEDEDYRSRERNRSPDYEDRNRRYRSDSPDPGMTHSRGRYSSPDENRRSPSPRNEQLDELLASLPLPEEHRQQLRMLCEVIGATDAVKLMEIANVARELGPEALELLSQPDVQELLSSLQHIITRFKQPGGHMAALTQDLAGVMQSPLLMDENIQELLQAIGITDQMKEISTQIMAAREHGPAEYISDGSDESSESEHYPEFGMAEAAMRGGSRSRIVPQLADNSMKKPGSKKQNVPNNNLKWKKYNNKPKKN